MKRFQDQLKRYEDDNYLFEAIPAGNYFLSVQGSTGAYSTPREITKPDYYTTMEIAVFDKNKDWLNVAKSSVFKKFPRFNELKECADGWFPNKGTCRGKVVFGYVPIDLIQDLYIYLDN